MRWYFHDCWISWVWYFLLHLAPYIFTRHCMTNSFTCVSSIKFKICSPSGFDPQVGWKKRQGATQWLTRLSLSSFTLRMCTNAKHCSIFFLLEYSSASSVAPVYFGVTHIHIFVSTDVGQIMCLYRIYKHGTRSVGRLRASPTSPLLCERWENREKVNKAALWSLGHNILVVFFKRPQSVKTKNL